MCFTWAAYRLGFSIPPKTRSTKLREIRSVRAMATGFMPAWYDALMRFALPVGTSAASVFAGDSALGGETSAIVAVGFAERRRLISAATSRCSVSRSTSTRPRSVVERFLGSVTLGGAGGSFADIEPADPGAWSSAVTSVGFGNAIVSTVPHRGDRSNIHQGTCGCQTSYRISHCIAAHDTSQCRRQRPKAHGSVKFFRGQRH